MTPQSQASADSFSQAGQALAGNLLAALARAAGQTAPLDAGAGSSKLSALSARYVQEHVALWNSMLVAGAGASPTARESASGDRRFAGSEWRSSRYYDYLSQSYLINARFLGDCVDVLDLGARDKERLRFVMHQVADALSPANFAATNPEVLKLALESNGTSISNGIKNLVGDLGRGRISTTDQSAFEVGRNLATTPGAVIFENDLIQLIQYGALTDTVRKRPLLIVPPCINKYYILDLQQENSLIRFLVEQGNTVLLVSWRNVLEEQGHYTWDDYLELGVIRAIQVARAVAGMDRINVTGYCIGGTMLAAVLAILASRGEHWAESATFLTALHDFAGAGEVTVFIDEPSVALREKAIGNGGVMPGRELDFVFSVLRANDLIWSYVVNNYLKGRTPPAFDLLHWNADSTNLPGPMYCYYVRNMYLENNLRVPGRLAMLGVPVDLSQVKVPAYVLATREDHIVPWKCAYASTQLLGGDIRFVLGASGHVAGVVNPASKNRRSYWTGSQLPASHETWLEQAQEHRGSWWRDWDTWLEQFDAGRAKAPKRPGSREHKPIEPAPGRYVKQRVV